MMFEVYAKCRAGRKLGGPAVSVRQNIILINKTGRELLRHPKSVELLFDMEMRVAGLRPADGVNAYRVQSQGGVSASAFINKYMIPKGRYDAVLEGETLCFRCGPAISAMTVEAPR